MNTIRQIIILLSVSVFTLFFVSCSSQQLTGSSENEQVQAWLKKLNENPKDIDALRNLSIYYVQTKQNDKAEKYLDNALSLAPDDPALKFYKGLNLEFFNKQGEALNYYKNYNSIPQTSPYRDLIEGRYLYLKRKQAFSDINLLIKNENTLSNISLSDSTLAVFPMIYSGTDKNYAPLSRGFSEMVSIDLAKIKQLKVLERIRIQAVLDELKFGQSKLVNSKTAPRAGKLLKAGTIVSGNYDVTPQKDLKVDLGSWVVQTGERKSWVKDQGSLYDLFVIEKAIVFSFLQANGIDLTREEKDQIQYVPTQNLQAFLLFSRGLIERDNGNYKRAIIFFQKASELDPNFLAASGQLQASQSLNHSGVSKEDIVDILVAEMPAVKNQNNNLVQDRLNHLNNSISSNFVQGLDSRNPAQEESNKSDILQPLPYPPPPPVGKGGN